MPPPPTSILVHGVPIEHQASRAPRPREVAHAAAHQKTMKRAGESSRTRTAHARPSTPCLNAGRKHQRQPPRHMAEA